MEIILERTEGVWKGFVPQHNLQCTRLNYVRVRFTHFEVGFTINSIVVVFLRVGHKYLCLLTTYSVIVAD